MVTDSTTTHRRRWRWHIALFLAPAIVVYTLFIVYPLVGTVGLSLYGPQPGGGQVFVGLENFQRLFADERWSSSLWNALRNTGVFFGIHLVVQNGVGLGLALLLTSPGLRARSLIRALVFSPTVLSVVLVGFVWQLILSPIWGVTPNLLESVGLGGLYAPWLGLESSALTAVSLMSVWQFTGIPMLLFSAALLSIPDDLLEAARVDGANAFRTFRSIQLPLILPTAGIVAILTLVGSSKAFEIVYVVQGAAAGPERSTDLMGTLFYRAFSGYFTQLPNPAMAATLGTVTMVILGVILAIYLLLIQWRLQRYDA